MAMATPSNFVDLPLDIHLIIFGYLDAKSFLALTDSCKSLHQPYIVNDASYWRHAVRSTFRVPNRPIVQSDGRRWKRLYQRLLTQSRVYTWGSNANGCLGHSFDDVGPQEYGVPLRFRGRPFGVRGRGGGRPARLPRGYIVRDKVPWPQEMERSRTVGVIADLQCGGWSTTILNDKGVLYSVGILDGQNHFGLDPCLEALGYPAEFEPPGGSYDARTAIQQFSSGRQHILGLADSGRIWTWYHEKRPATNIKFLHHDITETGAYASSAPNRGRVRQVVAGWNKSSAYITGSGIAVWEPIDGSPGNTNSLEIDTMLVMDSIVVPSTSYIRPKGSSRDLSVEARQLGETVGEVTNYIVLEAYVVFVTDLHRLFCSKIDPEAPTILELTPLQQMSESDPTPCVTDVQGSFRSFACLKSTGEVLTATQSYLDACWWHTFDPSHGRGSLADLPDIEAFETDAAATAASQATEAPFGLEGLFTLRRIPALQHAGVIALAFGDYHFHALHRSGSITSYGREPKACGALGLGGGAAAPPGDGNTGEGDLRGVRYLGFPRDGDLLPHAYTAAAGSAGGREVWFQREKATWLRFLGLGGADPEEAEERMALWRREAGVQGEVSDWIERQGRNWEARFAASSTGSGPAGDKDTDNEDDDGLGAYFALSVAAAGWHSGALVLVNDRLVDAIAAGCVVDDPTVVPYPLGPEPQIDEDNPPQDDDRPGGLFADRTNDEGGSAISRLAMGFARSFLGLQQDQSPATPGGGVASSSSPSQQPPRQQQEPPPQPQHHEGHPQTQAPSSPPTTTTTEGAEEEEETREWILGPLASPGAGRRYAWARDLFPRLRLSDGREMPGSVPLTAASMDGAGQ